MIKPLALSHEVLDQFSRNKIHINLYMVYFLAIAKAKVWQYLFGVITHVQKLGIKSWGGGGGGIATLHEKAGKTLRMRIQTSHHDRRDRKFTS